MSTKPSTFIVSSDLVVYHREEPAQGSSFHSVPPKLKPCSRNSWEESAQRSLTHFVDEDVEVQRHYNLHKVTQQRDSQKLVSAIPLSPFRCSGP